MCLNAGRILWLVVLGHPPVYSHVATWSVWPCSHCSGMAMIVAVRSLEVESNVLQGYLKETGIFHILYTLKAIFMHVPFVGFCLRNWWHKVCWSLATHRQPLNPLATYRQPLNPLATYRQPLNPLATHRQPLNPLATYRQPLNPLATYRQPLNPLATYRQPLNPLATYRQPLKPTGYIQTTA